MASGWQITLLGGLRAEGEGRVISRFPRQKAGALLAYLAYHMPHPQRRDALIELLWPEGDLDSGRNSLSVTLSWLRQQLEPAEGAAGPVLLTDRTSVRLNPDAVTSDVAAFDAALHAAERAGTRGERIEALAEAIGLYRGELLPGHYEDWVFHPREWLAERYFQALGQLLACLEEAGYLARGVEHARRGVQIDPLREEAHRNLIRLLIASGQPAAARRQYEELERRLKQELDATPSAATQALLVPIHEPAAPSLAAPPAPQSLPSGTVTFLMAQIEGSAGLWEAHPEEMRAALTRYDVLFAGVIARHGGAILGGQGAGERCFAVFARASQAVVAAVALHKALVAEPWPGSPALRARVALHTSEAEPSRGDYWGAPVNRCARLRSIAHGGQTLLSLATYELVCDDPPAGVRLRDLGTHRLKDLQRPEQVFEALHADLGSDFPPLRSLDAYAQNLPRQVTRFIGRTREMAEVNRLLASAALLTLAGVGGCGKTRLACQVAADRVERYPDGVWLVELAPLAEPSLVPQAIAAVLGIRQSGQGSLPDLLVDHLRPKRLLLVLDNCEHLLEACRLLVERVLREAPGVQVLTTSREPLNVPGEQIWRVPTLSLPDPGTSPPVERLTQYEAVELFVERATARQPAFAVTPANAPAVVELCHRLDGLSLAIELAAAWLTSLSVEQIAARLEDRFRLLTRGSPAVLPRQRTLRAAIDWSYDLLSAAERALLRRLSVFVGGFTLASAEAVCGEDRAFHVLDLLTSLVEKSLVLVQERETRSGRGGESRYRLLETIREYAREHLSEAGESTLLRQRHAEHCLAWADGASRAYEGVDEARWLDLLEAEHDNLRGALEHLLAPSEPSAGSAETPLPAGNPEIAVQLAAGLWRFWWSRGYWTEGREWLARVLVASSARTPARTQVLEGAGTMARGQGDLEAAAAAFDECLSICEEAGDRAGIARALTLQGRLAYRRGDKARAQAFHERSLALRRELGDLHGMAISLNTLGALAAANGDFVAARVYHRQCLAIQRTLQNPTGAAWALYDLGETALEAGDLVEARSQLSESLTIFRSTGHLKAMESCLHELGRCAAREAADASRARRAALLFGAARSMRDALGEPDNSATNAEFALVRAAMGEVAFDAAFAEGQAISLDEAIALAIEEGKATSGPEVEEPRLLPQAGPEA
jgi:predicted ATPase/DNA-binding SARP family transcriptional activator